MTSALKIGVELPPLVPVGYAGIDKEIITVLENSPVSHVLVGSERDNGNTGYTLNPSIVSAFLARQTSRVGIVAAVSPQRDHPYNIARRAASIDHISGGRLGVLVLRHEQVLDLGLERQSAWTRDELNASGLEDVIDAVRKLWRTWPLSSLDPDPAISFKAVIRYANHQGVFNTKGPLNSPTTPQGEPVVFWRWDAQAPWLDELSAAQAADVIIIEERELADYTEAVNAFHDAYQSEHSPLQLHVRVLASQLTADAVKRWRQNPRVAGLLLVFDGTDFSSQIERINTIIAEHFDNHVTNKGNGTLREVLGIPIRSAQDISGHDAAFAPVSGEPSS